ncbi:hypothetical protein [Burkholderia ambifaria]|uniref:hypothetical protein n=1 Tax=Burkholderia ambifaria TaxID=152480 RepID=UPI0011B25245|nr:hypothetical protein [Burkholderia ambifaria]
MFSQDSCLGGRRRRWESVGARWKGGVGAVDCSALFATVRFEFVHAVSKLTSLKDRIVKNGMNKGRTPNEKRHKDHLHITANDPEIY